MKKFFDPPRGRVPQAENRCFRGIYVKRQTQHWVRLTCSIYVTDAEDGVGSGDDMTVYS